jgi:hypothetical protein
MKVEVTQADRDLWEVLRAWPDGTTPREWTLHHIAHHRQAALIEGARMGLEAAAKVCDFEVYPLERAWYARDRALHAVRALDPAEIVAKAQEGV